MAAASSSTSKAPTNYYFPPMPVYLKRLEARSNELQAYIQKVPTLLQALAETLGGHEIDAETIELRIPFGAALQQFWKELQGKNSNETEANHRKIEAVALACGDAESPMDTNCRHASEKVHKLLFEGSLKGTSPADEYQFPDAQTILAHLKNHFGRDPWWSEKRVPEWMAGAFKNDRLTEGNLRGTLINTIKDDEKMGMPGNNETMMMVRLLTLEAGLLGCATRIPVSKNPAPAATDGKTSEPAAMTANTAAAKK